VLIFYFYKKLPEAFTYLLESLFIHFIPLLYFALLDKGMEIKNMSKTEKKKQVNKL